MDDIDLSDYKVTSEVHVFSEGKPQNDNESIIVSEFKFTLPEELAFVWPKQAPSTDSTASTDEDGDLVIRRKNHTEDHTLAIRHHVNTSLDLVGLQVWRGALLLADYLLHLGSARVGDSHILELGAGTGLTSIVAGMVAENVISTDISKGNILSLIETNIQNNLQWLRGKVVVEELDFYNSNYSESLQSRLEEVNLIIAADVVYHDDLTDAFLSTLKMLMSIGREKTALISLEKRFVFTINDLDVAAPCYEYFFDHLMIELSAFEIEQLDTGVVPQYFCYERAKELVLFRIKKKAL